MVKLPRFSFFVHVSVIATRGFSAVAYGNVLGTEGLIGLNILGVDFSGAQSDRNTWLAQGFLIGDRLSLASCGWVSRDELAGILAESSGPTVAALDFPFAPPQEFAHFWQPTATTMPDLWASAAELELPDFVALRDEFVARSGELKRACDPPESFSCLHKANPNMVPMTFRGMQLLHRLWTGDTANPMTVPPLPTPSRLGPEPATALLEVMPGAALRRLGLPYKGYKNGAKADELRRQILEELPGRAAPVVVDLTEMRNLCLANHDGLDAVVAAIAAALWAIDPTRFPQPPAEGQPGYVPAVLLEGWLYAPELQAAQDPGIS